MSNNDGAHINILFDFAKRNKEEQFTEYLDNFSKYDINVNQQDANGNYLLTFAVIKNSTMMTKKLLEYNAKLDIIDSEGHSILYYPIKYAYSEIVDILISYDKLTIGLPIINLKDTNGIYPLMYAIKFDNMSSLQILLSNGANPNYTTNLNVNSLHITAMLDNYIMVNMVVRHITDINRTTNDGMTALHYACSNSSVQIVKILLDNSVDLNVKEHTYGFTPIFYSVIQNDINIAKTLLNYKIDINSQDIYGDTIVHHCVRSNHDELFSYIMRTFKLGRYNPNVYYEKNPATSDNRVFDVNAANIGGATVAHMILYEYRDYYSQWLSKILAIANLNYQDNEGNTVMHWLMENDLWIKYISVLETRKINIFIKNNNGHTVYELIPVKYRNKYITMVASGYYNYLKKHVDGWEEKWQNTCSNKELSASDEEECLAQIKHYINTKNSSLPNKRNKVPIAIDDYQTVRFTTFIGTPLDIIVGVKYLVKKYKSATSLLSTINFSQGLVKEPLLSELLNNIVIQWYYQELKIPSGIHKFIRDLFDTQEHRFIIIPLSIVQSNGNHSNMLIIDTIKKEIERFEPHGYPYPFDYNYNPGLLDKLLSTYFTNTFHDIDTKYFPPETYMPSIGFQKLDTQEININTNVGDPNGFCALWSIWYADYRLKYEDINRRKLINKLLHYIRNNNLKYRTTIRNYSTNITELRDSYLALFDYDVNNYKNNTIDETGIVNITKYIINDHGTYY